MNDPHDYFLFPSPVSVLRCAGYEKISEGLVRYIYGLRDRDNAGAGETRSSVGGWQSRDDFFGDDEFADIRKYIMDHIKNIIGHYECHFSVDNMWANINATGGYNLSHNHPGADLSGVLFVQTPPGCGNLVFENKNLFSQFHLLRGMTADLKERNHYCPNFQIEPIAGNLVVFPSEMSHFVETNRAGQDRISISFNLKMV